MSLESRSVHGCKGEELLWWSTTGSTGHVGSLLAIQHYSNRRVDRNLFANSHARASTGTRFTTGQATVLLRKTIGSDPKFQYSFSLCEFWFFIISIYLIVMFILYIPMYKSLHASVPSIYKCYVTITARGHLMWIFGIYKCFLDKAVIMFGNWWYIVYITSTIFNIHICTRQLEIHPNSAARSSYCLILPSKTSAALLNQCSFITL